MPTARLREDDNAFVVNATVHLNTSVMVAGTLILRDNWSADARQGASIRVTLPGAGEHAVSLALEAANVALWWSNTYGAQPRYELTVSFASDGGGTAGLENVVHRLLARRGSLGFVLLPS